MSEEAFLSLLKGTNSPNLMVIGDMMLDVYVEGEVHRMSPEAPVPVLLQAKERHMLGGAGNVLANLQGLGVNSFVVSALGDDEAAIIIKGLCAQACINTDNLILSSTRTTSVKTRYMAGPHHLLRVDQENITFLSYIEEEELCQRALSVLPKVQGAILSDYGKGVLTDRLIATIIAAANARNIPVLVDPKGKDYKRYAGADLVTPNRKELAEAAGTRPLKADDEIIKASELVMAQAHIKAMIATRSEDGLSVIESNPARVTHYPTVKLPVYDVSGAGDTVIATLGAALAVGVSLQAAAQWANLAAGIVVSQPGTVAIKAAALLRGLSMATERPMAAQIIKEWQNQGLRVGFTNGCFDVLHYGHVSYLQEAKSRVDRLVVAVNHDASVKRLKGPTRPVNDEEARAHVLAALQAVDLVVLFGDETGDDDKPCQIIDSLRPDVIFKGGDYKESDLPEAAVARAYGGDVQIMNLFEGHSTTSILKKLNYES